MFCLVPVLATLFLNACDGIGAVHLQSLKIKLGISLLYNWRIHYNHTGTLNLEHILSDCIKEYDIKNLDNDCLLLFRAIFFDVESHQHSCISSIQ